MTTPFGPVNVSFCNKCKELSYGYSLEGESATSNRRISIVEKSSYAPEGNIVISQKDVLTAIASVADRAMLRVSATVHFTIQPDKIEIKVIEAWDESCKCHQPSIVYNREKRELPSTKRADCCILL